MIFLVTVAIIQNNKVSSLQSELTLSVASRDHLQKTHGTLIRELHKYKDTHEKMKKDNNDLSTHMQKLTEDYLEVQAELDKLYRTEKTKTWSEVRFNKFIQEIQDWSRKRVIEK
jgi:chromosome segregation ATPase